jgi:hypothetical protein
VLSLRTTRSSAGRRSTAPASAEPSDRLALSWIGRSSVVRSERLPRTEADARIPQTSNQKSLSRRHPARPLDLSEGVQPEPLRERAHEVLRTLELDSPHAAIPRLLPASRMEDVGLAGALRRRASDQPPRASIGRARDALLADREPGRAAASRGRTPSTSPSRSASVLRPAGGRPPAAVRIGSAALRGAFVVSGSWVAIVSGGLEPHLGPGRRRTSPVASTDWPIIGLPARLMS